jgi:hypothetical protein
LLDQQPWQSTTYETDYGTNGKVYATRNDNERHSYADYAKQSGAPQDVLQVVGPPENVAHYGGHDDDAD